MQYFFDVPYKYFKFSPCSPFMPLIPLFPKIFLTVPLCTSYAFVSLKMIQKPWGRYSLYWPIQGGSAQKGYPFKASGL